MMGILEPLLTEEELSVYKRGRNAKSYTSAKHASVVDYRRATGFEALIGYLYLKEDMDRIFYLVKIGLHIEGE
jgi:ribonuclease-3 family protein